MTENPEEKKEEEAEKAAETEETSGMTGSEETAEAEETPAAETEETSETADTEEAEEEELKIEGLEAEVEPAGPCKVEVKVRVPKEAIDAECAKTFDELVPNATIPGFRRGHAPRKLVERHHQDTVLDEAKRQLVARSWAQVRKDHELRPVSEPDLSDDNIEYDEEKGLSYAFTLEVAPDFDVKDYKGLELTKSSTGVEDEEVEKMLDNLRRRNAVLEPVEKGKTRQDDVPVVDCDVKVDGEVIQSVSDQEFVLCKDNWLRGLDPELWKELLGKKTGESATKTVTLPKTYQKEEYREKEAEVTVTIKDIKRPRLPELNDEFAKNMLYKDLEDLRKMVREQGAASKEHEARADLARQVREKLLAMVDFELPEDLIKRMTESAVNRQKLRLAYQGVARDEIEKAAGEIVEGVRQETEQDMRIYFITQQIADKEGISVSDSELENRIRVMAQYRGVRPARLREDLRREDRLETLRSEMLDEKTMEFLIAEAKVEEKVSESTEEKM